MCCETVWISSARQQIFGIDQNKPPPAHKLSINVELMVLHYHATQHTDTDGDILSTCNTENSCSWQSPLQPAAVKSSG